MSLQNLLAYAESKFIFCVQKAGHGDIKKMVIFIAVIDCLTSTASKH